MIRMVKTHNGYQIHEIVCDPTGTPVSSFPAIIQGMTRLDALKYMEDIIDEIAQLIDSTIYKLKFLA